MSGFLAFCDKYSDEQTCIAAIAAIADLRWPDGFTCDKCQSVKAYYLESRPRIYECATCGYQHSVTAGTILHKTRTPLRKWFMAAYLIGHDKRGVSALFISRELSIRYASAWLLCHKLRHALTETDAFRPAGLYRGRRTHCRPVERDGEPVGRLHPCQCPPWYADHFRWLHGIRKAGRVLP